MNQFLYQWKLFSPEPMFYLHFSILVAEWAKLVLTNKFDSSLTKTVQVKLQSKVPFSSLLEGDCHYFAGVEFQGEFTWSMRFLRHRQWAFDHEVMGFMDFYPCHGPCAVKWAHFILAKSWVTSPKSRGKDENLLHWKSLFPPSEFCFLQWHYLQGFKEWQWYSWCC